MTYQPKSYRKFLATSVAAAMVATVAAPMVLANFDDVVEGSYYSDAVDYLVEKEVLEGYPDGSFQPSAGVTRAEAAKILVVALGLEVETEVELGFTDTKDDVWYSGYVAALVKAGIVEGNPDGTFAPGKTLSRSELAKMVVVAYDLEQDANVEIPFTDTVTGAWYEDSVNTLYSLGIVNGMTDTSFAPGETVSRAQASVFVHRTEVEAVRLDVEKIVVDLMVESVSATNLKEVVVTFNQDLDVLTGEDAANYTFKAESNLEVASAVVAGNVVTLTVEKTNTTTAIDEHAAQQQVADLTIQNVESATGVELTKVTNSVRFIDVAAPEVVGVKVAGPRQVTVVFSEPLKSNPSYKFDAGTNTVVTTNFTVGAREVTLTLGSQPTEGSHKVEVTGGSDYANFIVDKVEKEFSFLNDTAAPVFTVKSATPTTVVLAADENFVNADNSNVKFYHTVKGSDAYIASKSITGKEITLTFTTPIPEGTAKFFLHYTNDEGTKIQDAWGNKVEASEYTFGLAIDRTAPTVLEEIVTVDSQKLRVTFSEAVTNADLASNYELKNADGDILSISSISPATQRNAYEINLTNQLEGGTYTLKVKNGVVDAASNKLVEVVKSFFAEDKKAPTVTETAQRITDKKVKVLFSEAMDVTSVTNKASYFYNSGALPSAVTITPVDNNKAVILDFTSVTGHTAFASGDTISVGRVSDAAGNLTTKQSTSVTIPNAVSTLAPVANGVKVVGKKTIEVSFNEIIRNYKADDFVVTSGDNVVLSVSDRTENGKTTIILNLETALATDATPTVSTAVSEVTAENTQGIKVGFTDVLSLDKLAPEIELVPDGEDWIENIVATTADGVIVNITVTFTEALEELTAISTAANYATVEGFTVSKVVVSGDTVVLTVAAKTGVNADATATPTVTLKNIADVEGNLITEVSGNAFVQ